MKAAVLEEFRKPLVIREVAIEEPGPDEITVEVKAAGLCLTDIHIRDGRIPTVKLPRIPGHETSGVVAKRGTEVTDFKIGDRVVICIDVTCGQCDHCLQGETTRCSNLKRVGFERNGGMAEFVNVPAANLEKLSANLSFEKASIIPDAVGTMYRGLKRMGKVGVGSMVAILGIGGLGMQGIKIAKLLGANVTVTSRKDVKLEMAKAIGADLTINTERNDFVEAAKKAVGQFDVVVDCIGTKESMTHAVSSCRNGGRVIALGYVDSKLEAMYYDVVIREKQILGSRSVSRKEFREVMGLVNAGLLDPDIGEIIPISQVNGAMEGLERGEFLTRSVLRLPFD
jgi:propanol-preferring alcohol dehydrogenase